MAKIAMVEKKLQYSQDYPIFEFEVSQRSLAGQLPN
jgi:hypothetical protein